MRCSWLQLQTTIYIPNFSNRTLKQKGSAGAALPFHMIPSGFLAAAAAVVVVCTAAAVTAPAAVAAAYEQQNQDDDPPATVISIATTHNTYLLLS